MADDLKTELTSIKRLLIVLLAKLGSTSEEIGEALELDASSVRKMISLKKVKRLDLPK